MNFADMLQVLGAAVVLFAVMGFRFALGFELDRLENLYFKANDEEREEKVVKHHTINYAA